MFQAILFIGGSVFANQTFYELRNKQRKILLVYAVCKYLGEISGSIFVIYFSV
jgi:hypothetical protein